MKSSSSKFTCTAPRSFLGSRAKDKRLLKNYGIINNITVRYETVSPWDGPYNSIILINYFKIVSNRFKVISYYSKTIKSNYFKILSNHFNVISEYFKAKKCILSQPKRDGLTVRLSHLRISDNIILVLFCIVDISTIL